MSKDADARPPSWGDHALVLALGLLACVLYAPTLRAGWDFEDFCLRGDWTWFRVGEAAASRYSPLGNVLIGAFEDPHALRAIFLALHSLTVGLVARTALNLGLGRVGALASAVIFLTCVHHTEPVVWMGGATYYVPMTALVASSTAVFTSSFGRNYAGLLLAGVLGGLSVFFHEQAVVLPVILLSLAWARSHSVREIGRAWWAVGLVGVAAATVAVIKVYASVRWGGVLGIHPMTGLERLQSLGQSILFSLPIPISWRSDWAAVVPVVWAIGLVGLRRHRVPLALLFSFGVSLFPPAFFSWPQARYFYMPSMWMALLVGALASAIWSVPHARVVIARVAVVLGLSAVAVANLWDFRQRRDAWIQCSISYDAAAERIVRVASGGDHPAQSVGVVDFPELLVELRELQRADIFRGCFVHRLEYEAEVRRVPMRFQVVRTPACVDCLDEFPVVETVDADRCFFFDRARMTAVADECPGPPTADAGDVAGAPPEEGRLASLSASASAYAESELNDLYSPRRAIDGDLSTEWQPPNESTGWLDLELAQPQEIHEVWVRNGHNAPYEDRATRVLRVKVMDGPEERHAATLRFPEFSRTPGWRRVEIDPVMATHVRLEVVDWHRLGGGVAEVVLR